MSLDVDRLCVCVCVSTGMARGKAAPTCIYDGESRTWPLAHGDDFVEDQLQDEGVVRR